MEFIDENLRELSNYLDGSRSDFRIEKISAHNPDSNIVRIGDNAKGVASVLWHDDFSAVLYCGELRDRIRTSLIVSVTKTGPKSWEIKTLNSTYLLEELE